MSPPRLGIVVPYRDRQEHLPRLLSHLNAFFRSESPGVGRPVEIIVAEQSPGGAFNRGAVINAGYREICDHVDYVCLHDVDALPLTADYAPSASPCMLPFYDFGFEEDFILKLFSCVVVMSKAHFEAANGFSNAYWGWGYEDVDLRRRLEVNGIEVTHRRGRFEKLPHPDQGSLGDGSPTPANLRNQLIYIDRWFQRAGPFLSLKSDPEPVWRGDGLNSVDYRIFEPKWRVTDAFDAISVRHLGVELHHERPADEPMPVE